MMIINNGPVLFACLDMATSGKLTNLTKQNVFFSVSVIIWPLQVDTNKDRLVSLDEFLVATKKKEFLEPDSWEVSVTRY